MLPTRPPGDRTVEEIAWKISILMNVQVTDVIKASCKGSRLSSPVQKLIREDQVGCAGSVLAQGVL